LLFYLTLKHHFRRIGAMETKILFEMTLGRKLAFISEKSIGIYKRFNQGLFEKKPFARTIALKKIISHLRRSRGQDNQDKAMGKIVLARLNEQMLRENSSNY
jgi:hypothetical protein